VLLRAAACFSADPLSSSESIGGPIESDEKQP
jgi:hypothetical protein